MLAYYILLGAHPLSPLLQSSEWLYASRSPPGEKAIARTAQRAELCADHPAIFAMHAKITALGRQAWAVLDPTKKGCVTVQDAMLMYRRLGESDRGVAEEAWRVRQFARKQMHAGPRDLLRRGISSTPLPVCASAHASPHTPLT